MRKPIDREALAAERDELKRQHAAELAKPLDGPFGASYERAATLQRLTTRIRQIEKHLGERRPP